MIGLLVSLVLCAIAWRFWPEELQVIEYRQLTRDSRQKGGGLFTDGTLVYFNETVEGRPIVASAPVLGGLVCHLNLPVASPSVLAISPDRRSLLLSDAETRQLAEFRLDIHTLRRIPWIDSVVPSSGAWDPTGQRVAVAGENLLVVFEPGKSTESVRLRFLGMTRVSGWDPDGLRLLFDVFDPKSDSTQWWELIGHDRVAHPLPRMSQNAIELGGAWTGEGRFFVFRASRGGAAAQSQIWIQETSAVRARRSYALTADPQSWGTPAVVPGTNTILAVASHSQMQLRTIPVLGGGATGRLLLPGVPAYELDYSRDGKWIAYTLYPEHTIWRCRTDGSDLRQLTPLGLEAHQPHWSPDATRIAFMGKRRAEGARWRVFLVPSPGGSLDEPLPQGEDQGVPTWTLNGRSLVFGDRRTITDFDHAAIHALDLDTRDLSTIVAPIGMWSPRVSPDGKHVTAISYDNKTLYIRDISRGDWRKCVSMDFLEDPSWPLESSWIQFVGRIQPGPQYVLFRVSPTCEQPKQILDLSGYVFAGDRWIGIAPDHSPIGLVRAPPEVYALDWRLKRRMP
jgi:Tol biopolymer transport system component